MLPDDDIRIDIGQGSVGAFMRMVHVPTGIERMHPGPLRNVNQNVLKLQWRSEIEDELISRGLSQYIIPTTKSG